MSRPKKGTNDQEHIIQAIIRKDYMYIWEQVKWIGYQDEPDINKRLRCFSEIVTKFDPEKNNNFIQFYKDRLNYKALNKPVNYIFSDNRKINKETRYQSISPTDDTTSKTANEIKNWNL